MKIPAMWPLMALLMMPANPALGNAPLLQPQLLDARPHQADSYTQGLFLHGGNLYESSGLYGRSAVTRWSFGGDRSPEPLARTALSDQYFAEGACEALGDIYVLTWREQTGFILADGDLSLKGWFRYEGEGWGLSFDGRRLWRSDGGSRLYPHRPGDFAPDGEPLTVRDGDEEVFYLNELEWDQNTGLMLANIYGSDRVAAVDLTDGRVRFWLDAAPLVDQAVKDGLANAGNPLDTVLNGLAVDGPTLWLTGKLWPKMYRISWPPDGWEK